MHTESWSRVSRPRKWKTKQQLRVSPVSSVSNLHARDGIREIGVSQWIQCRRGRDGIRVRCLNRFTGFLSEIRNDKKL